MSDTKKEVKIDNKELATLAREIFIQLAVTDNSYGTDPAAGEKLSQRAFALADSFLRYRGENHPPPKPYVGTLPIGHAR